MASSSGQVIASGDQRSSSTVPVISAISQAGDRKDTPAHFEATCERTNVPIRLATVWNSVGGASCEKALLCGRLDRDVRELVADTPSELVPSGWCVGQLLDLAPEARGQRDVSCANTANAAGIASSDSNRWYRSTTSLVRGMASRKIRGSNPFGAPKMPAEGNRHGA